MTGAGHPGYGRYSGPPDEPTPWAAGITVAGLVGALTTVGVFAFGAALTQVHPLFSLAVNIVAAVGIAPTAWRWRARPVTRWVLAGAAAGVLLGWIGLLAGV
ncbi:DUF2537 domain-containing protein [Nocardia carnea]|uniref:DUF2537 domain-containing protein n=1 Tax=Nocardia carnea TaxID=37328 RepID=UPI002455E8F8|nr:DUF2537 domain-containing protein [Nocardia carnea]